MMLRDIIGDFDVSLLSSQKDILHQKNKKLICNGINNIFSFVLYTIWNDY